MSPDLGNTWVSPQGGDGGINLPLPRILNLSGAAGDLLLDLSSKVSADASVSRLSAIRRPDIRSAVNPGSMNVLSPLGLGSVPEFFFFDFEGAIMG